MAGGDTPETEWGDKHLIRLFRKGLSGSCEKVRLANHLKERSRCQGGGLVDKRTSQRGSDCRQDQTNRAVAPGLRGRGFPKGFGRKGRNR